MLNKTEFIFYKIYINYIYMQVCSDCNKNEHIILNAVKKGHLECLKYAHLNGFVLTGAVLTKK
jgi:hypothetical protein